MVWHVHFVRRLVKKKRRSKDSPRIYFMTYVSGKSGNDMGDGVGMVDRPY